METGNRAKLTSYLMLGVISLILFLSGVQLANTWTKVLTSFPLAITVLFACFDKWIWRAPVVLSVVRRPWLGGTWRGALTSYRVDGTSGVKISSEHPVVLTVEQTFTSIRTVLMTAESKSRSLAAEFIRHGNNDYTLLYSYDNTPKVEFRDRSNVHRGTTAAEVQGPAPTRLESEYWTNRDTKGTFTLQLATRKVVGSFDEGNKLPAMTPKKGR
ncbi:hypothetical protein [Mycolicibacter terrae]|uniref:Cap15 family cyclic dinucleotide receptor domain-containing protein n=1 Tax=Mycolicibacter terrae TaxID=1788 RepID=UPI001639CA5C